MAKTTRTEPDPAGQICGDQVAYGMPWNEYCAEPKAPGKYFCAEHDLESLEEYGRPIRPPGAAKGG
ncbi:hypothetical protein [Streptomyces odontomachi]|uniref:hypothetical protein n=1 Tax=Streptomyces odontomachi TaxID=2944940 RepID=UPI002109D83F|nr:hypothetical protein [Streptomyces sp. ODS25]